LSVGTTYHGKLTLSRTSGVSANSTDYFFKFSVTAGNAAPNAGTISGDSPVNEGSSHSYSSDASDPDVGDTLSYTWSVTSGNASIGSGQGTSSVTLNFGDGLSTVVLHLVVDDGHGHSVSPTDKSITVNNVAPTVTLSGDNSANEGQTKSYTFTTSDPGQDTFSLVSESCGANGTLSNAAFNGTTGAGSFDCTFADGPASSIVSVQVKDSDDANSNTDTITVAIANVAPTATFAATSPINEGSSSSLSLSSPSDPSSADTTAGFKYSFACDGLDASLATTYAGAGTSSTANCPFDDNGSYTVKGRIFDKDNGYNTYQATVLVNNVAPTATFGNNGPVNEGSSATVSFSNQYDPSSADMTAGFHYAFACDNGDLSGATYAGSSASASTNCTFYDNGTYTVKGRIIDKDGGYTEYTTAVVVNNVAPEITSVVAGAAASCGTNNTITVNFTDPGTLDTWSASIDWGDGNTENLVSVTSPFGASHIYTNAGVHTVTVVVTDDDGGVSASKTAQVTLNFNLSGILQPVNPGPPNSIFKYKSTIPVKIQVQDCNGTYPSGLAIKIQVFLTSGATPGTEVNEPYSTSAADTTGFMRFTGAPDNQYIYNLATRSLPDTSGTYQIKLTIMLTNQIVTANFGLRP
jgi:hypothetical protein